LKLKFHLATLDRVVVEHVQSLIPNHYVLKLSLPTPRAWWRDWKWVKATMILKYKPTMGYKWLCSKPSLEGPLYKHWQLKNKEIGYSDFTVFGSLF